MNAQEIVIVGVKRESRVNEVKNIVTNHTPCSVSCIESPSELEALCKTGHPALLVYVMPSSQFSQYQKQIKPKLPTFLVITSLDQTDELDTLFASVDDFIMAPFDHLEFLARLGRFLSDVSEDQPDAQSNILSKMRRRELVGSHPVFVEALRKLYDFAKYDTAIMLNGETGVGKELFARAIHYFSPRAKYPFIPVECSSMPSHLIENELFGHEKGAYTDARLNKDGMVAAAEGGTLFFDEIDSLGIEAQSKLLRLLEEKRYRPVGSNKYFKANIRIIAATNVNLQERIREKQFRSDLYYRLNIVLNIPPLRDRASDIPLLCRHLMKKIAAEHGLDPKQISRAALQKLMRYSWPGNVRELRNVLQGAMLLSHARYLLPQDIQLSENSNLPTSLNFNQNKKEAIERFEREFITELLKINQGNVTQAAECAGKDRRDLGRLIKKYNINKDEFKDEVLIA